MEKTVTSSGEITGDKMPPPSITLLPDKRSPTNSLGSPARTGRSTPSSSDRKLHINGHASPSHSPHVAANSSSQAAKATAEGFMKTDDRMRLAKERREERERSLVAREQLIREKEQRARLQYERTVEERWRRLEEQRQKEELRRSAVEEKRRQQLEEDRERMEALMKRSLERSLQLEQRNRRWSRGCTTGGDSENVPLLFSAAFPHGSITSPLPAASGSAPCSPHRSPFCSSVNPADHSRLQGCSLSTPNTPKKERLRRDKRTASPGCGSPLRGSESPAAVRKQLASPTPSRLASKVRAQSPSNLHQRHFSPSRHRQSDDRKEEKKLVSDESKTETPTKKKNDVQNLNHKPPPTQQNQAEPARTSLSKPEPTRTSPSKPEPIRTSPSKPEPTRTSLSKPEPTRTSPSKPEPTRTSPSKPEPTRTSPSKADTSDMSLKGEHQGPDRKETPSLKKQIQNISQDGEIKKDSAAVPSPVKAAAGTMNPEEASRLLAERRRQARAQKELEERREEEERLKQQKQEETKEKEEEQEEEKLHRLKQEEEKQQKNVQEKELQAQMEKQKADIKCAAAAERQRLHTQQEEEERTLRKKRIEEIMKRTRKGEAELKKEDQEELKSPGHQVKVVQAVQAVKTVKTVQVSEPTVKRVEFQVREQVSAQKEKTPRNKDSEPEDQQTAGARTSSQTLCDITAERLEAQKVPASSETAMNGVMKAAGGQAGPTGTRPPVTRPPVTPLVLGPTPVIRVDPLDGEGAGPGEESMEVSPASKEDLISIPEFSPVSDLHQGLGSSCALEDLLDLTGSVTASRTTHNNMADCNRNLIQGVVSPLNDSKTIAPQPQAAKKLSIQ